MLMKFFVLNAYREPPQLEMKEASIPDLFEDDILKKPVTFIPQDQWAGGPSIQKALPTCWNL